MLIKMKFQLYFWQELPQKSKKNCYKPFLHTSEVVLLYELKTIQRKYHAGKIAFRKEKGSYKFHEFLGNTKMTEGNWALFWTW